LMVIVNLDMSPVYGNVRGYQLTGANNVVYDNAGYRAHSLILNDRGYPGVVNTGGNIFPRSPGFDRVGCGGFDPSDPTAQRSGRRRRDSMASASVSGSPTGTRTPVTPSSSTRGTSPTGVATTGSPLAMASRTDNGMASQYEGRQNTSALR